MAHERLKCLVKEYRQAEEKLNAAQLEQLRLSTALEIAEGLERGIASEIESAQESKDTSLAALWQEISDTYFKNDPQRPQKKDLEAAQKKFAASEKLIAYYTLKMGVIEKILGSRTTELMRSFEEKSVLMAAERSSGRAHQAIAESVDQEEKVRRERKEGSNFDRM